MLNALIIIPLMNNDKEIVRKFSKHLKALRKKYNFTQESLAEKAAVSYKNIQYLESQNPTCPSLITLNKLAKAFKMELSKFLKF